MIIKKNFIHYCFIIIIFISITDISISRKWSIEDLVQNVKEWNYLNDPEELITDKKLGPKIHTSYLKINYVYEKTDINLFYLSDVIEKYVYKRRQFVNDLYEAMLNSTEIKNTTMKKHHLFIVIFKKYNEVIFFGSSPELQKLLPADKVLNIEMEIKIKISKIDIIFFIKLSPYIYNHFKTLLFFQLFSLIFVLHLLYLLYHLYLYLQLFLQFP